MSHNYRKWQVRTVFKTPPTKPGFSQFNPINNALKNHFNIFFLQTSLSDFLTEKFHAFLISTTCYISHLPFPLCIIILAIFSDSYKLSSSSIMHFSPPSCHFLPCIPNIPLSIQFSNTLSLPGLLDPWRWWHHKPSKHWAPLTQQQSITSHKTCIFTLGLLTVKDKVPYPHKTMGITIIIQIYSI